MEKIISRLMEMDSNQLEQILEALKQRHAQLYPEDGGPKTGDGSVY